MSVADALMLMLTFGGFILTLVELVITVIQAIVGNQKDR
ncbi:putative holin-like toxin [Lacticaseibacillus kribbianus]|nr:putative holin-like toxin [Lacticaseibacillus kribbianus]